MTIRPSEVPDAMKRIMSKDDRKRLGKHSVTSDEAQATFVARNEKELQNQIASLLRRRGIWFDQDAMHKRRTGTKGTPDFLFAMKGLPFAFECKFGSGELSKDQLKVKHEMMRDGWGYYTIRDYRNAVTVIEFWKGKETTTERSE